MLCTLPYEMKGRPAHPFRALVETEEGGSLEEIGRLRIS